MSYCRECGAKLNQSDKFCPKCGNSISNEKELNTEELFNKSNEETYFDENTNDENEFLNLNDDLFKENNEEKIEENFEKIREDEENVIFNRDEEFENLMQSYSSLNNKNEKYKKQSYNNIEDEKQNNDWQNEQELKKKNKKKGIVITAVLSIAILVVLIFLFKDNLLYKVYLDKANSANVVSEKLINYNKALKCEYNDSIKDSIYNVVKNEADFLEQVKVLTSLNEEDLNKLISKIYVYNIKKALDNEDYKLADRYLQEAKKNNYEVEKIGNYNELAKAIDDKKTQEKKIKDEDERVKQEKEKAEKRKEEEMKENERLKQEKLSKQNEELSSINNKLNYYNYNNYDFIVPDSHSRYMTEKELGFYDKYTLGLIRNEIYARHGYVFSTQPYKNYFESKPWYYKDYNFKGTGLNKCEQANIDLILREEKRR